MTEFEDQGVYFQDQVDVPDRCKECPMVAGYAVHFNEISDSIQLVVESNMSGEIDERLGDKLVAEDGMTPDEAKAWVDNNKDKVAEYTAEILDDMDAQRDYQEEMARLAMDLCEGSMRLSGSMRGRNVTAHLCMSRMRQRLRPDQDIELATVHRYDAKNTD